MAAPRFSVVTPVYETPARILWEMLESVSTQSFEDWEHCLVDDASSQPHVRQILERAAAADPRVRVSFREANGGIVPTSNEALALASGEFVALLDHDDELHPDALALMHEALAAAPEADYAYSDEDKIDEQGRHSGPFFKPQWSPERMRTQMYTCHLSVLRRSLVEDVGGFDAEFEGSQDWDLVLKVTERARRVVHVPRILYHWRMIASSAAGGGEAAKPWAFEAGTRAIQAQCDRIGLAATAERDLADPGVYHLRPRPGEEPRVSIVVPTRGTVREVRYEAMVLVEHCVRSIVERSDYENYEIIVVHDAATPANVTAALREIAGERLRLVEWDRPFSFSGKINLGAIHADGEHLLLLNDDTEVADGDWLRRMVMYSSLPGVGAVGGKLIWEDGRLQHIGVNFEGGLPGHFYHGFAPDFGGYGNSVKVAGNPLAVTGALLMTKRALFEELGGLSYSFPVNYNDIDYCLKLQNAGQRVVYDPDLVVYHFESSSRETEVEDSEKELLLGRWAPLTAVDPNSNPNLRRGTLRLSAPFAWIPRRRPRLRKRRPKERVG